MLAAILAACAWTAGAAEAPADPATQAALKVARLYGALAEHYVDPLDPDRVILDGAVRGMLAALDPFSAFFDRAQFAMLQQQARGEALGFGSILYVTPGKVLVLQTAEGSPSWRAGLGPGDEIVAVNGTRVADLDFNSLVQLLQQSRSKPVTLGVIHPGKVVAQDLHLKPAEVALPTVDKAFLWSPGIAYLHVSGFESKTPQEVVTALEKMEGKATGEARPENSAPAAAPEPLRGLLLDLRDNHGGMVDAALAVASLFLRPGELVLSVRGRSKAEQTYKTFAAPYHFDMPMIVLVNGNTASAAEVLAAALEEHDRAVIAGEPTFGKGVVETVMPLSDQTGLALTTAQYFTPSGRSIQRPLPGTALAGIDPSASTAGAASAFHTDDGRPLRAGGGITPDVEIPERQLDPWATFLNQRGAFTDFASEYLSLNGPVGQSFQPDARVLEDFRSYLNGHQIRAPQEYWGPDQDYLKLRIKTEIFNLVYGLAAGDEVETRGDPQVEKAVRLFGRVPELLRGAAAEAFAEHKGPRPSPHGRGRPDRRGGLTDECYR